MTGDDKKAQAEDATTAPSDEAAAAPASGAKKAAAPGPGVKEKFRAALDAKHSGDTHGVAGAGGPQVRDSEVHGPRRTFRRKSG